MTDQSPFRFYQHPFRLGILGGGQLGRMFIQEAININVGVDILDPDPDAPCKHLARQFTVGDLKDYDTVYAFGQNKDLLTIEIEHVNVDALETLEKEGVKVYPQPRVLRIVQDKGLQKQFYHRNNIPTAPYTLVQNKAELKAHTGYPLIQKLRKGGYDGKGVVHLKAADQLEHAFDAPSILEDLVDFKTEISVIVARNARGEMVHYPVVDMEFNPEANLVEFLFAPSQLSGTIEKEAIRIAYTLTEALDFVGIVAVEMFVTQDNRVLVNEIAPRPHNSGHHTIEANVTSQYGQHLRAILNLPLGSTAMILPSVMVNLLGEQGYTGEARYIGLEETLATEGAFVHLYGKKSTKPFRKMGHVTVISKKLEDAKKKAYHIKKNLRIVT